MSSKPTNYSPEMSVLKVMPSSHGKLNENSYRKQKSDISRKQVSISQYPEDRKPFSPLTATNTDINKMILKKGESNDSISYPKAPG